MKLTLIAGGDCHQGTCPTIWDTGRGEVVVQGFQVFDHGLDLPAGEDVVRLPCEVILAAARALARDA